MMTTILNEPINTTVGLVGTIGLYSWQTNTSLAYNLIALLSGLIIFTVFRLFLERKLDKKYNLENDHDRK